MYRLHIWAFMTHPKRENQRGGDHKYCIVTDPPFNVWYHYDWYDDNMEEDEYYEWLGTIFTALWWPLVVIHYPEELYKIAFQIGEFPDKVVSWVYNSNTTKQHRDIAFFWVEPDFKKVRQPYKNPNDKRIKKLIAEWKTGGRLYDRWNVNQVKNVSKKDNEHPCVMPLEVMKNIIWIFPEEYVIVDPFMWSWTTAVACKELWRDFVGCELNPKYCEICWRRLNDKLITESPKIIPMECKSPLKDAER